MINFILYIFVLFVKVLIKGTRIENLNRKKRLCDKEIVMYIGNIIKNLVCIYLIKKYDI